MKTSSVGSSGLCCTLFIYNHELHLCMFLVIWHFRNPYLVHSFTKPNASCINTTNDIIIVRNRWTKLIERLRCDTNESKVPICHFVVQNLGISKIDLGIWNDSTDVAFSGIFFWINVGSKSSSCFCLWMFMTSFLSLIIFDDVYWSILPMMSNELIYRSVLWVLYVLVFVRFVRYGTLWFKRYPTNFYCLVLCCVVSKLIMPTYI